MGGADMKPLVDRVLSALYAQPGGPKVVLAATGGGVAAAPLLFRAGSSSTMLQFSVPYARASLQRFVEPPPSPTSTLPKFVSREMAERMAESAWSQAQQILWDQASEESATRASGVDETLVRFRSAVGVGCTASLASNYDRRGVNQAFISLCRVASNEANGSEQRRCETYHVHLDKTAKRSREEEDRVVSHLVVYLLAKNAEVDSEACAALLEALKGELQSAADRFESLPIAASHSETTSVLDVLMTDKLASVAFLPTTKDTDRTAVVCDLPFKGLVLPGSFNPLHKGHTELALAAKRLIRTSHNYDLPVAFEIAVANADKGSIAVNTVEERVRQFSHDGSTLGTWPVIVTNAMLFSQKAELLRGCIFVIGADTAVRLVDKKYYDNDEHKMVLALTKIADNGCSFVIAGRYDEKDTKRFISAEEVCSHSIPRVLRDMFIPLREEDFRNDLSSTQLRNAQS